jgi:micrococcal nuclease
MNKFTRLIQIFVLFSFGFLIPSSIVIAGEYKITRVYDGDSVLCEMGSISIKVRLAGIDAPETSKKKRDPGQPYSQQATKYLAGLVLNKNVEIKGYGNDKYNRVLAEVFIDGKNINLEMIKQGLAEVYRGKPAKGFKVEPYQAAEKNAKKSLKGMWSLGDKYISP